MIGKTSGTVSKQVWIHLSLMVFFVITSIVLFRFIGYYKAEKDTIIIGVKLPIFFRGKPNYLFVNPHKNLNSCQENLKRIGTALEMYSCDNAGHYPRKSLTSLLPDYLSEIPHCASAKEDTYTKSYEFEFCPGRYTMYCSGHHHKSAGIDPNYPRYTSTEGLIPDNRN